MGLQRVKHDCVTELNWRLIIYGLYYGLYYVETVEKEMATLQRSCLENPRDGGAWWAAIYGVAQSWTRLK